MQPTEESKAEFKKNGYLLISGLIPRQTVANAESAMWGLLGAEPDYVGSWQNAPRGPQVFADPSLMSCYTGEFLETAEALAGFVAEDLERESEPPSLPFQPHRTAFTLNVFPKPGEWKWPGPHIDHALRSDDYPVFPPPIHLATMTYLNDVAPHSGGTVVWPGSHQRILELARERRESCSRMWQLNEAMHGVDLGEPTELTPRAGDVLFYHYLLAHAGSSNIGTRPRFAMNSKW